MLHLLKGRKSKMGLPAGTLIHVGERKTEKVEINIFDYNENNFKEKSITNIKEISSHLANEDITWIAVNGIHDTTIIETIGELADIHHLTMEDILNTGHRPKIEDYDNYLFTLMKIIDYDTAKDEIQIEQMSIVMGKNFIITFHENSLDGLTSIHDRIRNSKGRIREMGADYLYYAIIDIIVDKYFILLENIGEKIGDIEEELISNPSPITLKAIHKLKREMIYLRKAVWPLREIMGFLNRTGTPFIGKPIIPYIKDVYDHIIQVMDTTETFRDMISVMFDIYLSSINNKMNQVMKVLTIIATIFIPLTFIAGIYGMNFKHMPELQWRYGYFLILGIMFFAGLIMVILFKKKKWL